MRLKTAMEHIVLAEPAVVSLAAARVPSPQVPWCSASRRTVCHAGEEARAAHAFHLHRGHGQVARVRGAVPELAETVVPPGPYRPVAFHGQAVSAAG
jgi:hypothetical protein